jgi:UDP-N-acetylglucosamine 2-epimerase (hydrolysing)
MGVDNLMQKKILFLTATRAEFGKMKPLMRAVDRSRKLKCYIFVTGMHVLSKYGLTYNEILKEGFKNVFTFINQTEGADSFTDLVLANTVQGLGYYVRQFLPDLIVVHGDRPEALAGAIVGALNNILVLHVEGGEISGTVDESIRHAVSKLAQVHCVANHKAHKRLIQLGEDPSSVYVIGSPEVDTMLSRRLPSLNTVKKRYGFSFKNYGIFCYHPVTTELPKLQDNISTVINALRKTQKDFIVIEPNNDKGSDIIYNALNVLRRDSRYKIFPSLRFEYYITLLKNADVIVGNSSSGVREASIFGVPCLNIGTRQNNRIAGDSIINVPENEQEIMDALALCKRGHPKRSYFGLGNSTKGFMKILNNPSFWHKAVQKQFCDVNF